MESNVTRKTHRVAKACDACHRKKIKCNWRSPSCVDCLRLGLACTYTRLNRETSERQRARYVLDGTNASRAQHTSPVQSFAPEDDPAQLNDRNEAIQSLILPILQPQNTTNDLEETENRAGRGLPRPDVLQPIDLNQLEATVTMYFTDSNHFFPIFSEDAFRRRVLNHSEISLDHRPAWIASIHAVLAGVCHQKSNSDPVDNAADDKMATQYLQTAMSEANKVALRPPSLLSIQALACTALCLQQSNPNDNTARNFLAVAIRMAYTLGLHRLDEVTDITVSDRMEKLRLFWCLYILDKETAMLNSAPPFIDDEDVYVLEPRMVSDDRLGLVESLEGISALNLFTARQRLARIESAIWKELYTFKAMHKPQSCRMEAIERLNGFLAAWKAEWFDYGHPKGFAQYWPEKSLFPIIKLQFTYFLALLRANPDVQGDTTQAEESMQRGLVPANASLAVDELQNPMLVQCIDAARRTLYLARENRKGGLKYLCSTLPYTVPAIAILLAYMTTAVSIAVSDQDPDDQSLARNWLDVFGFIVSATRDQELQRKVQACEDMFNQIQRVGRD